MSRLEQRYEVLIIENSPQVLQMLLKMQHMLLEQGRLIQELMRKVDLLQPRVISSIPPELKNVIKKEYTNTLTSDNFFLGLSLEDDDLICMKLATKYLPKEQQNEGSAKVSDNY